VITSNDPITLLNAFAATLISSCEKKERCDDHSDSDKSELATSPAFSVFWMRNRKNLDEESDHVAAGGQHHPHSKAHEGFFENAEAPG
jgi:hypothetical protein